MVLGQEKAAQTTSTLTLQVLQEVRAGREPILGWSGLRKAFQRARGKLKMIRSKEKKTSF